METDQGWFTCSLYICCVNVNIYHSYASCEESGESSGVQCLRGGKAQVDGLLGNVSIINSYKMFTTPHTKHTSGKC